MEATEAAGSRAPGAGAGPLASILRPRRLTDAPSLVSLKNGACSASAPVSPQLVGLNHARSLPRQRYETLRRGLDRFVGHQGRLKVSGQT